MGREETEWSEKRQSEVRGDRVKRKETDVSLIEIKNILRDFQPEKHVEQEETEWNERRQSRVRADRVKREET